MLKCGGLDGDVLDSVGDFFVDFELLSCLFVFVLFLFLYIFSIFRNMLSGRIVEYWD